eukprot:gene5681-10923_t
MPTPMRDQAYNTTSKSVKDPLEEKARDCTRKAASGEREGAAIAECKAMFDGTWCKRGFSTLQGAVTCILAKTGKGLDFETSNKVCYGCAKHVKEAFGEEKYVWVADFSKKLNTAQWTRLNDGKAILENVILQSQKPGFYKQNKKVEEERKEEYVYKRRTSSAKSSEIKSFGCLIAKGTATTNSVRTWLCHSFKGLGSTEQRKEEARISSCYDSNIYNAPCKFH